MTEKPCGCLSCQDKRRQELPEADFITSLTGQDLYFRYACEICGNKRCPHHSDHPACMHKQQRNRTAWEFLPMTCFAFAIIHN